MIDPIVQTKTCHHCQSSFAITQGDLDFYAKISPTFDGQKFQIPTPTLCPDCRQRRRLSFRNERNLYRRSCDASGKQIISMYNPNCGYKVYDQKIRWSDSWDAMDYEREFDFSRSFSENFKELSLQVPRPSMYNFFAENSDYCNCTNYQKDCYLTSASLRNEKCIYSAYTNNSNNCIDSFMTFDCENSYYTIDCEKSYKLLYASNCRNCSESYFVTNCNDCSFCRNCEGLDNKKYCIDNIQYEKEEYNQRINDLKKYSWKNTFDLRKNKKQNTAILFSEGSDGYHLRYCKDSKNCIDAGNLESCKNCTWFFDSKNCMDNYSRGQNSELCYENVAIGENIYAIYFCANVNTNCRNMWYSMHCRSSSNCFGCIGLHDAEYCIFNKQYTKDDYEKTVAKIINYMIETGEWGEFFHPSLSPFGYNETVAQEYYPLQNVQNVQKGSDVFFLKDSENSVNFGAFGYHRSTYESPKPVADKVIQGKDLPESIDQVEDTILQSAIACEVTGKLFRIQPQELVFYRKHNIPLPRRHPDQRHLERLALRR